MNYPYSKYIGFAPKLRNALGDLFMQGSLPPIRGEWIIVDPNSVNKVDGSVGDITTAYGLCVDGRGDGILLMSSGNSTAETTSYMTQGIDWVKEGITVVGACAPVSMYQRARVASKSVTTGALTTIAFPTTTTITDSASGFITAGFKVGMNITIDTAQGSNDGNATITGVTAGTITCSGATFTVQTAAAAGATTIINYIPYLIDVQASNCAFMNLSIGNWLDTANDVGCVKVTGARNYFGNVHMVGGGGATSGSQVGSYDLMLDGSEETRFDGCVFGTDTILKAAENGEVLIDGLAQRAEFNGCKFFSSSATADKGAVKTADAAAMQGVFTFAGCQFINWTSNGITTIDDVFIGTAPTSGAFAVTPDCISVGYTGWGDNVYVATAAAAAAAAGQIATVEA